MIENSGTHYITLFVFLISLICVAVMLISGLIVIFTEKINKEKLFENSSASENDQNIPN
jgi:hypothetical protein